MGLDILTEFPVHCFQAALVRMRSSRPRPFVSEQYVSVFTDRRCPGAGQRSGGQPYARLDPVRCYNWKGSQAAIRKDVGSDTNLDIIVRSTIATATTTTTTATATSDGGATTTTSNVGGGGDDLASLQGVLELGPAELKLLAAVFYAAGDVVWLANVARGLGLADPRGTAAALVGKGWLVAGAACDDFDAWAGLLLALHKSEISGVAKKHRLPGAAGNHTRLLVACMRAIQNLKSPIAKSLQKATGPILRIAPHHATALGRAHVWWFMSRNYDANAACSMLRQRIVSFTFASDAAPAGHDVLANQTMQRPMASMQRPMASMQRPMASMHAHGGPPNPAKARQIPAAALCAPVLPLYQRKNPY